MEPRDNYDDGYEEDGQRSNKLASDNDEGAEYDMRQGLCAACHAREKDFSESRESILCYECRQEYIRLRVPQKINYFLAAVCAVFVLSIAMLPPVLSSYRIYLDAEKNMENREFSFAYNNYSAVLERYSESVPVTLKAADAAMSAQNFGNLAEILDTYLVGKSLNNYEYDQAMVYSDFLDSYFGTLQEINNIIGYAVSSDEQAGAQLVYDKLEALLTKENIDKTLVYFYLGNLSQDSDAAIKYLKLAANQDSRSTYPYSYYGNALRRSGKLDEAMSVYWFATKLNANDANSLRGISILQLLEGQKELSLETIRTAYEMEPQSLYVKDAFIIALSENGLHDEAAALLEQFAGEGFQADEDLQAYLDGNIGLEQYYTD